MAADVGFVYRPRPCRRRRARTKGAPASNIEHKWRQRQLSSTRPYRGMSTSSSAIRPRRAEHCRSAAAAAACGIDCGTAPAEHPHRRPRRYALHIQHTQTRRRARARSLTYARACAHRAADARTHTRRQRRTRHTLVIARRRTVLHAVDTPSERRTRDPHGFVFSIFFFFLP